MIFPIFVVLVGVTVVVVMVVLGVAVMVMVRHDRLVVSWRVVGWDVGMVIKMLGLWKVEVGLVDVVEFGKLVGEVMLLGGACIYDVCSGRGGGTQKSD